MKTMHRGFTLLELLVVVVILAILLSMIFPMGLLGMDAARSTQCKAKLQQWGVMWQAYVADHDGRFTPGLVNVRQVENGIYEGGSGDLSSWARGEWIKALGPYIGAKSDLLVCPIATEKNPDGHYWGGPRSTYVQGNRNLAKDSSYGLNCWMFDPPFWVDRNGNRRADSGEYITYLQGRPARFHFRRINAISEDLSWIPVFLDSMWRGGGPDHNPNQSHRFQAPKYNGEWFDWNREMMHFAMDRHQGGVNGVFADGSVRHIPVKQLWRLKWHREFDVTLRDRMSWPGWIDELSNQFPAGYEL